MSRTTSRVLFVLAWLLVLSFGCSSGSSGGDDTASTGTNEPEATQDSGDTGSQSEDTGSGSQVDSGTDLPTDSGSQDTGSGSEDTDTTSGTGDTGTGDTGSATDTSVSTVSQTDTQTTTHSESVSDSATQTATQTQDDTTTTATDSESQATDSETLTQDSGSNSEDTETLSDTASDSASQIPCGNGDIDGTEECDDGTDNSSTDPDACRESCVLPFCGDQVVDDSEGCDDGTDNSNTAPDACREDCVSAFCGDGVVDASEECDDNFLDDELPNACRTSCREAHCGDDVIDSGETCDDGELNSNFAMDACRRSCVPAFCGDGVVDTGETCDSGAFNSDEAANACRTTCEPAFCGDGVVDSGESCDEGLLNSEFGPGCLLDCVLSTCGDGNLDAGEECDQGGSNSNDDPDACRLNCTSARCGDGVTDGDEECDNGPLNSDDEPDACRTTCQLPFCGDGVIDADESCDQGDANSDTEPGACRTSCLSPYCGDSVIDPGEQCDAGGYNSNTEPDTCRTSCRLPSCGDNVIDNLEECDNGPLNSNIAPDACRTSCEVPWCGDDVVDLGEECDDGPLNSDEAADACRTSCRAPWCGDNVVDLGESCDDGPLNSDENAGACRTSCDLPWCGDDVVDLGEECDDGPLNSDEDADACRTSCKLSWCGDEVVDLGESCDHGPLNSNTVADACRTSCEAAWCGDGVRDSGEECDSGELLNSDTEPNTCRTTCERPWCGDGVRDTGEACDDGDLNSDTEPGACRTNCALSTCGDHTLDPGEECDDGDENSDVDADACRTSCERPWCGDDVLDTGELCDDGVLNSDEDADACRTTCVWPFCGDGAVDSGESCDDGVLNSDDDPDACRTTCGLPFCGDFVTDSPEGCDDGDLNSNTEPDACREDCAAAHCGDHVVDSWEMCDDGVNDGSYNGCAVDCLGLGPFCGDGLVQTKQGEQCDGEATCGTDCMWQLACESFTPLVASNQTNEIVSLAGQGFGAGLTVVLEDVGGVQRASVAAQVAGSSAASVEFLSTLGLVQGEYDVILRQLGDADVSCPLPLTVTNAVGPTLTAVDPGSAWSGVSGDAEVSDPMVALTGTNFVETPYVAFISTDDPAVQFYASSVIYRGTTRVEAVVPSESEEMPLGTYYVQLVNPSGLSAYWKVGGARALFEVTDVPPPRILELAPFRSPAATNVTIAIHGGYFQDGAVAQLVLPTGALVDLPTTFVTGEELSCVLASSTPGFGQGLFPIRVENPDGQYDVYYSYQATPSSAGHLDSFENTSATLSQARWRHASVEGFDPWSGSYLYTSGGLGVGGAVLATVEILPITVRGAPETSRSSQQWTGPASPRVDNTLKVPRQGHAMVRSGRWLYVLGGAGVNTNLSANIGSDPAAVTSLASVERAMILDRSTRPVIEEVGSEAVGSLVVGTWTYQVSALGPWGESLPSSPKMVFGKGGTVTVFWAEVAGASAYNVYRNANPANNVSDVRLLASQVSGTQFFDDGTAVVDPAGVQPLPPGALGRFELVTSSLNIGREGLGAVVVKVGGTPTLYVVGGRQNATGDATSYLRSGARATIDTLTGDLSAFAALSTQLNTPRAFFELIKSQGQDKFVGPGSGDAETGGGGGGTVSEPAGFLMAILGDSSHPGTNNKGLSSFEVCRIQTSGDIGAWSTQAAGVQGGQATLAMGALLYFDYLFTFGGVKSESLDSHPTAQGNAASRFNFFDDPDPAPPETGILFGLQSTSASFAKAAAYYEILRLNGYNWVLGGNDGAGPLANVQRTPQ